MDTFVDLQPRSKMHLFDMATHVDPNLQNYYNQDNDRYGEVGVWGVYQRFFLPTSRADSGCLCNATIYRCETSMAITTTIS